MSDGVTDASTGGSPPTVITRIVRVVTMVEMGVAGVAALLIFLLLLLQAAQRYLPIEGYTWTGELARFCLVWLTFAAVGVLVTRDGHIALQIVDNLSNPTLVRVVHVASLVLVAVISAGFAWACESLVSESANLTSPSLGLPMSYVYVVPMLGFLSAAVRASVAAVLVARHGVSGSLHPEELEIQVNPALDADGPAARTRGEDR
jgi:TRAP-type C4-dicarboxylate transport system permease small subunit